MDLGQLASPEILNKSNKLLQTFSLVPVTAGSYPQTRVVTESQTLNYLAHSWDLHCHPHRWGQSHCSSDVLETWGDPQHLEINQVNKYIKRYEFVHVRRETVLFNKESLIL